MKAPIAGNAASIGTHPRWWPIFGFFVPEANIWRDREFARYNGNRASIPLFPFDGMDSARVLRDSTVLYGVGAFGGTGRIGCPTVNTLWTALTGSVILVR